MHSTQSSSTQAFFSAISSSMDTLQASTSSALNAAEQLPAYYKISGIPPPILHRTATRSALLAEKIGRAHV